jgi:hypothetical protein
MGDDQPEGCTAVFWDNACELARHDGLHRHLAADGIAVWDDPDLTGHHRLVAFADIPAGDDRANRAAEFARSLESLWRQEWFRTAGTLEDHE